MLEARSNACVRTHHTHAHSYPWPHIHYIFILHIHIHYIFILHIHIHSQLVTREESRRVKGEIKRLSLYTTTAVGAMSRNTSKKGVQ